MSRIKELADKYGDYAVAMRREFHQNPEPSMEEERAARRVIEELAKLGLEGKKVAGT
jgi:amidohydrolase